MDKKNSEPGLLRQVGNKHFLDGATLLLLFLHDLCSIICANNSFTPIVIVTPFFYLLHLTRSDDSSARIPSKHMVAIFRLKEQDHSLLILE